VAKQFFADEEGDQGDEEDSWCDEELTDEEMLNLDEVDDATFDLHCPVKLLDATAKRQVLLDIASLSPEKKLDDTEQDIVESQKSSPAADIVDSVVDKEGLFMYNKPPPPLPKDHPRVKKQVTLSEAWNQKLTVSANRKSKARSDELYTFVYSTMTCATCFPDSGVFRISVGDEHYKIACLGTKWFDTEFIGSFVTLLAHDAHMAPPQFSQNLAPVQVITCNFPTAAVMEHQVKEVNNTTVKKLLLVAFSSNHFAVLEFDLTQRTVAVFDGLNLNISQWKDHVVRTLREYGIVDRVAIPQSSYSGNKEGKTNIQRLEIRWSDKATWVVGNSVFMRQKDGHNCGPIACCKVMEVLGFVADGTINRTGNAPGAFRKLVMNKYNELITKYNDVLMVQMSTKEDGDGNVYSEEVCICGDPKELEGLYTLECCGRKVHIECLAVYLQTVPFCMFCSRSLSSMYDSLPERTFSQQHTLSQTSQFEKEALVEGSEDIETTNATTMSTTTATTATSAPKTPAKVIPDDEDKDDDNRLLEEEEDEIFEDANWKAATDDEDDDNRVLEVEDETMEDVNRNAANKKKRKMQQYSAEKEMKRLGEELVAEGLGVGAVVTCKVDYRTFVHAEGLVAIVYKCSEFGGAIVCTENGVLTHDGSEKDYYVPSDKFVIQAGVGEVAVIPDALQKVRDDIMDGKYDYEHMPRISYSKQHQLSTNATSPCKRVICGCKGNCNSRCGCRRKNLDCTSGCGCSGNCNWRKAK
jgi:hypothetical protein